jgi:hypothetical protein
MTPLYTRPGCSGLVAKAVKPVARRRAFDLGDIRAAFELPAFLAGLLQLAAFRAAGLSPRQAPHRGKIQDDVEMRGIDLGHFQFGFAL